ncbi:MAG: DUF2442 domain-containing protein [Planctomycetes bacterium]|nr:DUF2442 domain-containing protein [Planctomycetota bacterium]
MIPRVIEARYARDYTLWIRFQDGTEGEVDLRDALTGEVFRPLRSKAYFKRFALNREMHTLTWPNGADFAPEFLHSRIAVPA